MFFKWRITGSKFLWRQKYSNTSYIHNTYSICAYNWPCFCLHLTAMSLRYCAENWDKFELIQTTMSAHMAQNLCEINIQSLAIPRLCQRQTHTHLGSSVGTAIWSLCRTSVWNRLWSQVLIEHEHMGTDKLQLSSLTYFTFTQDANSCAQVEKCHHPSGPSVLNFNISNVQCETR